ncbi:MAG: hypothetical protein QXI71_04185 [Candidatus Bathyarchaeia archaeon]
MVFDIEIFSQQFMNVVDWMLTDVNVSYIRDDIRYLKGNSGKLQSEPDSLDAFKLVIELIKTNSWRLRKPSDFDSRLKNFVEKYGLNFRVEKAKEELFRLVGEAKKKNVEQFLEYPTIKDFTDNLYNLAKIGKSVVLGEKGRDNYLRDFGYWDRIPIDRHEMRFIIRSGIYHACSVRSNSDSLEKGDLQDALSRFCSQFLKNCKVDYIDLGNAPGIVDLFIWSYSAEGRYNICGATPKCENCKLKDVCLYAITNKSFNNNKVYY